MRSLLILYPGCIVYEAALAVNLLQHYTKIDVAGPTLIPIASSGLQLQPNLRYADITPADYACIILPGGDPASILSDHTLRAVILAAHRRSTIIAGICAGVLVLASTGILRGRRITHNYTPRYAPRDVVDYTAAYWQGTEYVDQSVIRDGHLITALPQAHIDFATAILQALGFYTAEKAEQMATYFRGGYPFG